MMPYKIREQLVLLLLIINKKYILLYYYIDCVRVTVPTTSSRTCKPPPLSRV